MDGPTIVITGASRGLGAGLARAWLARGANVVCCARSTPELTGEQALALTADVTHDDAVARVADKALERFGGIDLWINNAGVLAPIGPLRDLDSAEVAEHLRVNILGVFHGSKHFVRLVRKSQREGVLINISSGAARSAYAGWSPYCAGKAAVDRMTECIALEEQDTLLRAYSIAPGIIDTDMQTQIRACDEARFPMVNKFLDLKNNNTFSSPQFIADRLWDIAFDKTKRPSEVCISLPLEHG